MYIHSAVILRNFLEETTTSLISGNINTGLHHFSDLLQIQLTANDLFQIRKRFLS